MEKERKRNEKKEIGRDRKSKKKGNTTKIEKKCDECCRKFAISCEQVFCFRHSVFLVGNRIIGLSS